MFNKKVAALALFVMFCGEGFTQTTYDSKTLVDTNSASTSTSTVNSNNTNNNNNLNVNNTVVDSKSVNVNTNINQSTSTSTDTVLYGSTLSLSVSDYAVEIVGTLKGGISTYKDDYGRDLDLPSTSEFLFSPCPTGPSYLKGGFWISL
jgi:hypothetical protein